MNRSIKESDWKKFKSISESALEKFSKDSLQRVSELLEDKSTETYEKTFKILDFLKKRQKLERTIFGDYRRSTAEFQFILMAQEGLLEESDISNLSEELREKINLSLTL